MEGAKLLNGSGSYWTVTPEVLGSSPCNTTVSCCDLARPAFSSGDVRFYLMGIKDNKNLADFSDIKSYFSVSLPFI